ncbi:MAG: response regulator [Nitrospiraceae bacterium]
MAPQASMLLVEDSPGEDELFRLAIEQAGLGISLRTETDPDEAFRWLEQTLNAHPPPSLILLDLNLCGRHGCGFLRRLRTDARFRHLPVVVFTNSDAVSDISVCYGSGANGYVVKPSRYADLVQCVEALCRYWLTWNRISAPLKTRC